MEISANSINIGITVDEELVKRVVKTPKLFELSIGDGSTLDNWEPKPGSVWLHLQHDEDTIGVMLLEPRGVLIEWHWYVLPQYWGKPVVDLVAEGVVDWLLENTDFIKILGTCPSTCPHTIVAAKHFGMEVEGFYTNAMIWKGELVDAVHLTKQIRTLEEMNDKIKQLEKANG